MKTLKKKIRKKIQFVQLMENPKKLEKMLRECFTENSRLKKKRSYWSTKYRKLETRQKMTSCPQR